MFFIVCVGCIFLKIFVILRGFEDMLIWLFDNNEKKVVVKYYVLIVFYWILRCLLYVYLRD